MFVVCYPELDQLVERIQSVVPSPPVHVDAIRYTRTEDFFVIYEHEVAVTVRVQDEIHCCWMPVGTKHVMGGVTESSRGIPDRSQEVERRVAERFTALDYLVRAGVYVLPFSRDFILRGSCQELRDLIAEQKVEKGA